jgi:bidirectional [NiFe] hydrogenase diaphorase subunit
MSASLKHSAMPSTDKRWRIVEATMRRHGYDEDALIESLHTAQESFGYLDDSALKYVAAALHVPVSKVYGVATFYHFFTLRPPGEHTCVVCMGTACYIKGAQRLLDQFERTFGIKNGQTTKDGKFSLLTARCLGSCGLAPAAVIDGEVEGMLGSDQLVRRIADWRLS